MIKPARRHMCSPLALTALFIHLTRSEPLLAIQTKSKILCGMCNYHLEYMSQAYLCQSLNMQQLCTVLVLSSVSS